MKRIIIPLLLASSIISAAAIPFIPYRSQSENAARELVLWQTQINRCCMESNYGSFTFAFEYTRSFQLDAIASDLFCTALTHNCCEEICPNFQVQGSKVVGRASNALFADYFGLPTDYNSTVNVEPRIQNYIFDLDWYIGLDRFVEGLYFRLHAPVVQTIYGINASESITTTGNNNYPVGYFNNEILGTLPAIYGVDRDDLGRTFKAFVSCQEVPHIDNITFQPLQNARFSTCSRRKTAVSDLQIALGWNFLTSDKYHVGINLRGAAPTGNRPEACWLFEPIVGNGKHWELGAGLSLHGSLWQNEKTKEDFSLYFDANITHLFKARQCRTFDLKCKPLSRYMLAEKMTAPAGHIFDAPTDGNAPNYQFADEFAPVANLTTISIDSSMAVQGDLALKFAYTFRNFQFDIGYEFWARSCEKISPRLDYCKTETGTWALKGDAFVYGFALNANPPSPLSSAVPVALSATESDATIYCGTSNAQRSGSDGNFWESNPGVDNAELAYNDLGLGLPGIYNYVTSNVLNSWRQMYSSFNPVVFSTDSFDHLAIQEAQTRGISHKLFCNFGYLWQQRQVWVPFLGIGVEVEMGKHSTACCTAQQCINPTKNPGDSITPCGDCADQKPNTCCCPLPQEKGCRDCAISQWGAWIKAGITYH